MANLGRGGGGGEEKRERKEEGRKGKKSRVGSSLNVSRSKIA